ADLDLFALDYLASPALPPGVARHRLTAFVLEAAGHGISATDDGGTRALVEWACFYVRNHVTAYYTLDNRAPQLKTQAQAPDGFDLAWSLASVALLERSIDPIQLEAHVAHVATMFPGDQDIQFARAIALEQRTSAGFWQRLTTQPN